MTHASVIVPTVTPAKAVRLLDSLGRCEGDLETLGVANGPGDAELGQAADRLGDAEVVRATENLGYSRAMNLGARHARGEAIVLLNDDVTLEPDYIRLMPQLSIPRTAW